MSTIDLSPILTPIIQIVGIVVGLLVTAYVPIALAAFQKRTGIQLTDQQRATVLGAVQTAAGTLETKLDQGVVKVAQINVGDSAVAEQAQKAINAVPDAMKALGMTQDSVARIIVGKVDTAAHGDPPVVPLTKATPVAGALLPLPRSMTP